LRKPGRLRKPGKIKMGKVARVIEVTESDWTGLGLRGGPAPHEAVDHGQEIRGR
jgi:hypothetical protein